MWNSTIVNQSLSCRLLLIAKKEVLIKAKEVF